VSILQRVLRNSGWLLGAELVSGVLLFAQAVMITRALGVEGYGVLALVTALVLAVVYLFDSRTWETIIKFVPQHRVEGHSDRATATVQLCYLIEIASGVGSVLVLLVGAELAARVFIKDPVSANLVRLYAVIALIRIPQEPTGALLRLAGRFDWLSYQTVVIALVNTVGTALVWWTGATVGRMLGVQLAGAAVGSVILLAMGRRVALEKDLPFWRRSSLRSLRGRYRELLRFALLSNLTGTSRILSAHADVLVLGFFGTPAAVGVYDLAKKLVKQAAKLSNPLYASVFPEISRLISERKHAEVRRLQRQLTRALLALVIPACAVVAVAAPWLVLLVFGDEFEPAGPLLQILIWQFLWLPLIWLPGFLLSVGRPGVLTSLTWTGALIHLALVFALVPGLGAPGAAIATTAHQLLWVALATGIFLHLERTGWYPRAAADQPA
jgi:stage V sporulation protein B